MMRGDIRNLKLLREEIENFNPEIIIHLAAQPLVIESYKINWDLGYKFNGYSKFIRSKT